MLTFRRAIVIAAVLLSFFYLLRHTHSAPSPSSIAAQDSTQSTTATGQQTTGTSKPSSSASDDSSSSLQKQPSSDKASPAKKSRPQIALEDMATKPLRTQLEYQFPYDGETKFPAYVWQTWKATPASGEFPDEFRSAEASWTEKHPTFVHEVITDNVAVHLFKHLYASVPQVLEAYNALPLPVLKADFFRYLILLARGGIYTDIDTTAIRAAYDWVPEEVSRSTFGLVIGIEADPDRPDWADWYSRRIQFCQWTIQAKPGHPVLREIVAHITEETLKRKEAGKLKADHKDVVEFTGPAVWTDLIFKYFNDERYFDMSTSKGNISWQHFTGIKAAKKVGDVVVLPITSFSPGVGQMGAGDDDDPMAFVKHTFHGSWKPEELRHIGEDDRKPK